MINFFRKIRQNLLVANKTGKYFKYATGEIVLVVLGIMIALQVNDWNQKRQLKSLEIEILNDFKSSLQLDLKVYDRSIDRGNRVKNSIGILLHSIENDMPYSDSLKYHFGNLTGLWGASVNNSIFESLKSEGLSIITNKELRLEIIYLYGKLSIGQDNQHAKYRDLMHEAKTNILSTRFDEFWKGNYEQWSMENNYADSDFTTAGLQGEMRPIDFEKLKKDPEFLFFLKSLKNIHFWYMEQQSKSVIKAINNLLLNIDNELKSRKHNNA